MEKHTESTKELFLNKALLLFSKNGYEAVSVAQIACDVGCTAPALYKHYSSKQELFDAILEESVKGYQASMERLKLDFENHPEQKEKFVNMTEEEQIQHAKELVLSSLNNERANAFRKLMIVEQFNMSNLAEMYNERYVFGQYKHYEEIFKALIEAKKYKESDPYMMAVSFVSPLLVLVGLVGRDSTKEEWAMEIIERHVKEFNKQYRF